MDKKAQSAMEFLMTYGWAILVVLAAIGALAYFGVLTPNKFLPEKCTLPAGIFCADFKLETNQILVVLLNAMGRDLIIKEVSIGNCTNEFDIKFPNGAQNAVLLNCTNPSGRLKERIEVSYFDEMTSIIKVMDGDIQGEVRD